MSMPARDNRDVFRPEVFRPDVIRPKAFSSGVFRPEVLMTGKGEPGTVPTPGGTARDFPCRYRGAAGRARTTRVGPAAFLALCASIFFGPLQCAPAFASGPGSGQPSMAASVMAGASRTGPLKTEARIKIPVAAGANLIAAEAPDGAVFLAPVGEASTTVVWVVDGNRPAAVAEHVSGAVQALAADSENLYVATYKNLLVFNRRSGDEIGHWPAPKTYRANASDAQLLSVSASNGTLVMLATLNNNVDIYRLNTASTSGPHLVAVGTSAAFGPDGSVYFSRGDHHLASMTATGATIVGPKLTFHPNGLGGGVQFVDAVAGGVIWVVEPAGQGLDATFSSFDARTLKPIAHWFQPVDGQIVGSDTGTLVLGGDGFSHCPQPSPVATECVYRLSSAGVLSGSSPVGAASVLLGPDPAVVTTSNTGTVTYLDRLS
jgi:hypothetical protein